MTDFRVELSELTAGAEGDRVLAALDSVQITVEAPAERCQSPTDQAGIYTLVNLLSRLHPHLTLELPQSPSQLTMLGQGEFSHQLEQLIAEVAPQPTTAANETVRVSWGGDPSAPGLAVWGGGWSYSVGPRLLLNSPDPGPGVGALAAAAIAAAQITGSRLAPLGFPYLPTTGFVANLLDYRLGGADAPADPHAVTAAVLFGGGSVGSSAVHARMLLQLPGGVWDVVDDDAFSPRNQLRYPILRAENGDSKACWIQQAARAADVPVTGHNTDVTGFLNRHEHPPAIANAVVSVDTVEGRRDATDALARRTLNVGVGALSLHISAHDFDGQTSCAYCQYVDQGHALGEAGLLAQMIGLPVDRVIAAMELRGGRVDAEDVQHIQAGGPFASEPPQSGDRLADLRRRVYAQAAVPVEHGQVLVSAPYVSMFAGVLICSELLKAGSPNLADRRLTLRADFDLSGEPSGVLSATARDATGRCLCYSAFRRRAHRQLHA